MPRRLEPELMDDPERAAAYAAADFSEVNQRFVDGFLERCPRPVRVLDVGCGPADIPIRLAKAAPQARVTGIDGSPAMLALGLKAAVAAGVAGRLELHEGRLPGLPVPAANFDALLCNSVAHHLPEPSALWREIGRAAKPGAFVYVMDLLRPGSEEDARQIVEGAAAEEHPLLKEDFYNSLLAAFTLEEVRMQLEDAGLGRLALTQASERHWLVAGNI